MSRRSSRENLLVSIITGTIVMMAMPWLFAIGVVLSVWQSYVAMRWWNWFAVPIFGVGAINVATVFAVIQLVGWLQPLSPRPKEETGWLLHCLIFVIVPLLGLGVGWCFHWLVVHEYVTLIGLR